MKTQLLLTSATTLTLLAGCAPAHLTTLKKPQSTEQAEVLVYRESAFNAAAGSMIVGTDESDIVELYGDRFATILLPAGEHTFFARANGGDKPFKYKVSVAANQRTCIKGSPNPANYAKAFLPLSYYFGNTFLLEQTTCPSKEELAKFEQVSIDYKPE